MCAFIGQRRKGLPESPSVIRVSACTAANVDVRALRLDTARLHVLCIHLAPTCSLPTPPAASAARIKEPLTPSCRAVRLFWARLACRQ